MLKDYEFIATGRNISLFEDDVLGHIEILRGKINESRIAIIGAAGSIGSSVSKYLLRYEPKAMVLFDLSENNLVEIVRDLRSSNDLRVPDDFSTLPIGIGSREFTEYFKQNEKFDYILNLSAMKHVRSEKDTFSISRMIKTNIVYVHDFLTTLSYKPSGFFSVSSDKAANPANVMGASKMAMEEALFASDHNFTTARFANVAFSDGSLPHGFLRRIEKKQPLSAPLDISRYFISHEEAAQLCILSCFLGERGDTFFPVLNSTLHAKTFPEIAKGLLSNQGYSPVIFDDEQLAKSKTSELIALKKWPCHFFKTDTTGEKQIEEFYAEDEEIDYTQYESIGIIKKTKYRSSINNIQTFISFFKGIRDFNKIRKEDYVRELQKVVPSFGHNELGKNLDDKM